MLRTKTGAEASWDDAVLSFSVTDQALTSDGVLIELCSGNIGAQDLVASGTIPGDITMQLICRLRSEHLERGHNSTENNAAREYSTAAAVASTAAATTSGSLAVEVRLFDKAGGKDAGVCTLNMQFRPDGQDETRKSLKAPCIGEHSIRAEAQTELEASAMASSPRAVSSPSMAAKAAEARAGGIVEEVDHHKSSLILLEETARHIEEIKEVQFGGPQDEARLPLSPSIRASWNTKYRIVKGC